MLMYRGIVEDRMNSLETHKTKYYYTHQDAYNAAWKLAKRYYTGERAGVWVDEVDHEPNREVK